MQDAEEGEERGDEGRGARRRRMQNPERGRESKLKYEVEVEGGGGGLHVLFLGRASDPLKGVKYLEQAVREVNSIELRIVSDHRGEELERDWAWCDVLCLPTLSENFGLVVAEALERGKRVITTDGAPAWGEFGRGARRRRMQNPERGRGEVEGLVYLRGFREGTERERVEMLKEAMRREGGRK